MDYTVARTLNTLYIYLDIAWLVIYLGILFFTRRRLALLVGLAAGLLYFVVDYGGFYLVLGTRQVHGADPFWFLLWLSFSYGITNFAWIWLLLDRDGHAVEWSLLPILGWITVALLSQGFGARFPEISISRGTGSYHGIMVLILLIGYLVVIINNLRGKEHVKVLRLMAIGIGIQFAWEAALLVSGIRPAGWMPIVVNSLIETNLGLPWIYYIHRVVTKRYNEGLAKIPG